MSDSITQQATIGTTRRQLLTRAGGVGIAALATGVLNLPGTSSTADAAQAVTYGVGRGKFVVNDNDILNFALQLEYLEAEYYQRGVYGTGLTSAQTGLASSNVVGGSMVPFVTTDLYNFAKEIAFDEVGHVNFLRKALGKHALPEPAIDFTTAFNALAVAAGIVPAGGTFNPFDNETDFLLGQFLFQDVGVTAYVGASPYVRSATNLTAAAGILAVEAYQASEIRTLIYQAGGTAVTDAGLISALRNKASNAADPANLNTDQNVVNSDGTANIVPTNAESLAFSRTFAQVLNIVYASTAPVTTTVGPIPGGFFPNGLNGRIR